MPLNVLLLSNAGAADDVVVLANCCWCVNDAIPPFHRRRFGVFGNRRLQEWKMMENGIG